MINIIQKQAVFYFQTYRIKNLEWRQFDSDSKITVFLSQNWSISVHMRLQFSFHIYYYHIMRE